LSYLDALSGEVLFELADFYDLFVKHAGGESAIHMR